MKCYDIVQDAIIRANRFDAARVWYQRHPAIGDQGTIVEEYWDPAHAFEVECSDGQGITIWLETMYPDELTLVEAYPPDAGSG